MKFGEIQILDCGKCHKKTSHVFSETRKPNCTLVYLRGWQCSKCKNLVVVQTVSVYDKIREEIKKGN